MTRILFVCLGNICRSPLAEGIMRRQIAERGLEGEVEIDSAGTGDWHVGQLPDPRARAVGMAHGSPMKMRGRQVAASDFDRFDLILAMDRENVQSLARWRNSKPEKVHLLRSYDPNADGDEVPDPFDGDPTDFEEVADMIESACRGVLDHLIQTEAADPDRRPPTADRQP